MNPRDSHNVGVALLTGGSDKPYVMGLVPALAARETVLDLIGSDELQCPQLSERSDVRFLNLRGSQLSDAGLFSKVYRILSYYVRLLGYAIAAKPKIFHILWNNKFEYLDRTLVMLYYLTLGKKIVLTVHNVNAGRRDATDSPLNRLTLRAQYQLAHHLFVHTAKMKAEIVGEFGVPDDHITVIPFGINNAVPNTRLTSAEARERLGLRAQDKAILFFGRITPYKGLEYLIKAFRQVYSISNDYRLIIAGRPDNCEAYWKNIQQSLRDDVAGGRVLLRPKFIPDDETEVYFKAADLLVLPYKDIYQSGVLFLAHSFGLPVLAADVGSLKDDIVEGKTGLLFRPEDPVDLAKALERYFASDLYANLGDRRPEIQKYANERHSWDVVGDMTISVYTELLGADGSRESLRRATTR